MKRPELEDIFHQYSGEDCVLSAEELQEFLHDQGEETSLQQAKHIIQTYELNEKGMNVLHVSQQYDSKFSCKPVTIFCPPGTIVCYGANILQEHAERVGYLGIPADQEPDTGCTKVIIFVVQATKFSSCSHFWRGSQSNTDRLVTNTVQGLLGLGVPQKKMVCLVLVTEFLSFFKYCTV